MAGSPTKPGNWGDWATIHGVGIYESEYDQSQVSKTQENENSIKRILCVYAKISGSSWRICTCSESSQYKNYCKSQCACFKENTKEAVINSPPKKNHGHGDWDAFDIPRLQKSKKNKKKYQNRSVRSQNKTSYVVAQAGATHQEFLGATVEHKLFGTGKIIGVKKDSVLIDFHHNKLNFGLDELLDQKFTIKR